MLRKMSETPFPLLVLMLILQSSIETEAIGDRENGNGKPSDFVEPPSEQFSGGFLVNLTDTKESDHEKKDKKPRTAIPGPINLDLKGPPCCASKHVSFSSSRTSERHQPSRYDDRSEDRFGWQSYDPSKASSSNSRPGDRYPPRPSYGAPSKYGSGSSSNSGSTGGYGYGYGYGESSNSGYGSYGSRPGGGGGGGYGGSISGPPHGIYGSFGDGDEFAGGSQGEIPFPEGGPPMAPNNIQTQKAVALKALAGVALIGAAAALATNPVLLPLGLVAGRKKREVAAGSTDMEFRNQYVMMMLQKIGNEKKGFAMSPKCVARLTCEIQKEYVSDLRLLDDGGQNDNVHESLERRFMYLIQNNVLNSNLVSPYLKKLIKFAITVGSSNRSCDILRCNLATRN